MIEKLLKCLIVSIVSHSVILVKLLHIEEDSDKMSFATVKKTISVQKKFVICTSHLETFIEGKSYLTIYSEDNSNWISLRET